MLTQGRVAEAIDAFNQIAKFNGVTARIPKGATFQEQVEPESVAEITNEIPINISQLVANNFTLQKPDKDSRDSRVSFLLVALVLIIGAGVNNAYWLTLLYVTSLGGNKFVNCMLLGSAEMLSGIFTGALISCTNSMTAFQVTCVMSVLFNATNQFWVAEGSIMASITLFAAILGVGGAFTGVYVLIAEVIPVRHLGSVMVLQCSFAVLSTMGAPLVALAEPPIPYFYLASLITLAFVLSLLVGWAQKRHGNKDIDIGKWVNERSNSLLNESIN